MIKGKITEYKEFENKNNKIFRALKWLMENKNLPEGTYEIEGKEIYAIVQSYSTREYDETKWEAHKKYTDIQYIEKGYEKIGVGKIENMIPNTDYINEKDIQFFNGRGNLVDMSEGDYLILFPQDLHMPCIGDGTKVKKIVVKVSV